MPYGNRRVGAAFTKLVRALVARGKQVLIGGRWNPSEPFHLLVEQRFPPGRTVKLELPALDARLALLRTSAPGVSEEARALIARRALT